MRFTSRWFYKQWIIMKLLDLNLKKRNLIGASLVPDQRRLKPQPSRTIRKDMNDRQI